jgi:hypothetical protein
MVWVTLLTATTPGVFAVLKSDGWTPYAADLAFSPEMFAYACIEDVEVQAVLTSLKAQQTRVAAIDDVRAEIRAIHEQLIVLRRSPENNGRSQIDALKADLSLKQSQVRGLFDLLFEDTIASLPEVKRSRLRAWRESAASKIPAEMRVVSWSASEIKSLEAALVAEKRAQTSGKNLDSLQFDLLRDARTRSDVQSAQSCFADRLDECRQIWADAQTP